MKDLTTIAKLDAVLDCLNKHRTEKHHKLEDLAPLLNEEYPSVDFGEITSILNKLEKDGYIEFDDRMVGIADEFSKTRRVYRITFEGRHFIENGGYVEEKKSMAARKRWEDGFVERAERNAERLNRLTLLLGIGTIGLVLVELIKMAIEYHWFSCGYGI
jgi:DNA-binding PadR family transcriptional regulator